MSGMCFTLMANMGDGGHNQPVIKDRWGIRKLTERECARLQGYKDSWLKKATRRLVYDTFLAFSMARAKSSSGSTLPLKRHVP
jgi:site-specific DNA-cytosine methylase